MTLKSNVKNCVKSQQLFKSPIQHPQFFQSPRKLGYLPAEVQQDLSITKRTVAAAGFIDADIATD
jgi:hypothetical protein